MATFADTQLNIPVEAVGDSAEERRWDRGAWLTLAIGLLLLLLPVILDIASFQYPSDGWDSASATDFGVTGPYRMLESLTGDPSTLQPEDIVLAINGRVLDDSILPPIPSPISVGQTLSYTIERKGEELVVDVPLVRLAAGVIGQAWLLDLRNNLGFVLFAVLLLALGVLVFVLRPGNTAARYLFLLAMFVQGISLTLTAGLFLDTYPAWLAFLIQTYGWGWVYLFMPAITMIALSYPVPAWPLRRFPRLTPFLLIGLPLLVSVGANFAVWYGRYLSAAELLLPLTFYSVGAVLILIPLTLMHNLRTLRDALPRAQMRLLALGFGLGLLLPITILALNFMLFAPGGNPAIIRFFNLMLILLPLSLAVGILRYRFFDIDVIVRRTTSYTIITILLGLTYLGSIVILQSLFGRATGQESTVAVVLSTLLIAALFLPLRRRVQDWVDRRFFRQKYNAEKVLEQFAVTVRDETDLDALTAELVRVIQETMQPSVVSIVLIESGIAHLNPPDANTGQST